MYFFVSAHNASHKSIFLIGKFHGLTQTSRLLFGDNAEEPLPHVKGAQHLQIFHIALFLQEAEQRRHSPAIQIDFRSESLRQYAGQIVGNAAARNMRHTMDIHHAHHQLHQLGITDMGFHKRLGNGAAFCP